MNERAAIVAVLAGGRGSRLGGDKALAVLGGQALITYPLAAAREAGLEAVVVAKRSSRLPSLAGRVRYEPDLPEHPLCGVVRGLEYARERGAGAAVLIACDMPFGESRTAALAGRAAGGRDGATAGTPAARARSGALLAAARAAQGAGLAAFADGRDRGARAADRGRAGPPAFGPPEELCFNVNRPEELERAALLLARRVAREREARAWASAGLETGPSGDPAWIGAAVRSDASGRDARQRQQLLDLLVGGRADPRLGGELRDPFRAVHRRPSLAT